MSQYQEWVIRVVNPPIDTATAAPHLPTTWVDMLQQMGVLSVVQQQDGENEVLVLFGPKYLHKRDTRAWAEKHATQMQISGIQAVAIQWPDRR